MYNADDTIVAIATPPGRGGIGVVRVSGPDAHAVVLRLTERDTPFEPRHATLARTTGAPDAVDQVVVTFFKGPHSYTGEDVVEISAHGSPVLLRGIVRGAMLNGSRLARPGEFTLRAFVNGRIDLVQAEAVRDLIEAVTPLQTRAAFDQLEGTLTGRIGAIDARLFELTAKLEASIDFPEEGYHFIQEASVATELTGLEREIAALVQTAARGRLVREGLHVAIVGRPNVGKSSLFNRLSGVDRAIVTDRPGTTRDLLTETIDVLGIPMTIVDTAGVWSEASDAVEVEGIVRARLAQGTAALTILVLDWSVALTADDFVLMASTSGRRRVLVANKSDLPCAWPVTAPGSPYLAVSAAADAGLEDLRSAMWAAAVDDESPPDVPPVTNLRHAALLASAGAALARAVYAVGAGASEEFVLADVHEAMAHLQEVTGARTPEDLLAAIFSRFCIGK